MQISCGRTNSRRCVPWPAAEGQKTAPIGDPERRGAPARPPAEASLPLANQRASATGPGRTETHRSRLRRPCGYLGRRRWIRWMKSTAFHGGARPCNPDNGAGQSTLGEVVSWVGNEVLFPLPV